VRLSVVICTWNRCESLRSTLESLRSLVVPAGQEWELLVVDNNSSDATHEVIAEFRDTLPLRPLFVAELGLSRARNAAARAAAGDLILFTDDDVSVDPHWMTAFIEAADRWPDAGYFAGAIRPRFAAGVPAWVERNQAALAGMLCVRDLGSVERRLRSTEFPFGPNMAIRRTALARGSFDERLGRSGDRQVRGGESSLFWALRSDGIWGVWVPAATVEHYVPPSRASVEYLWSYYRGCGRAQARLAVLCGSYSRWHILSAPMWEVAKSGLWWWVWARHVATAAWLSGQMSELARLVTRRGAVDADEPACRREYS
jgi:glycosyltransferase involved in cell wall biosynthesis